MKVAFNSSPLIFLSKLRILGQAISIFTEIFIPDYVCSEISRKKDAAHENLERIVKRENVFLAQTKNKRMVRALNDKLGMGESEAIVIAIENLCDVVVLDDNVARREALRYGLNVKGTLGIIKKMFEEGLIHIDLDHLYHDLQKINFRVKRSIYEEIFKE